MNLIGERIHHKEWGPGAIVKLSANNRYKPVIHVELDNEVYDEFEGELDPMGKSWTFEYHQFGSGEITAVRDEVQRYIVAQAETQKDNIGKARNIYGKADMQGAHELVRDELQPGESLLYCVKVHTAMIKGFFSLIPGLFCSIFGAVEILRIISGDRFARTGTVVFYLVFAALFLWCAFRCFTAINKNHYFVTDKRFGIREAFAFRKARNKDIPINEISFASHHRVRHRRGGGTSYLIVGLKADKSNVRLTNPPSLFLLQDAINEACNLKRQKSTNNKSPEDKNKATWQEISSVEQLADDVVLREVKSGEKLLSWCPIANRKGRGVFLLILGILCMVGVMHDWITEANGRDVTIPVMLAIAFLCFVGAGLFMKGVKYKYCFVTDYRVCFIGKTKRDKSVRPETLEIHKRDIEKSTQVENRKKQSRRVKFNVRDPQTGNRKKYSFIAKINDRAMTEAIDQIKK